MIHYNLNEIVYTYFAYLVILALVSKTNGLWPGGGLKDHWSRLWP